MGFITALSIFASLSVAPAAQGAPPAAPCVIHGNDGRPFQGIQLDPLYQVLSHAERCPEDIFELRQLLGNQGGRFNSTMVANRGFHNSTLGSFSFFESVERMPLPLGGITGISDLFFGHFVGAEGETLAAQQSPEDGNLMIELIAWDSAKGLYNFYELIGDGAKGKWFYRGDSADIVSDAQWLHRQRPEGVAIFGDKLRCSGCHVNGGPIMKELAEPHNDWWRRERPLPLAGKTFERRLAPIVSSLSAPGTLAEAVKAGNHRLQQSAAYQAALAGRGLQAQLRPLFSPQEVNFESDAEGDEEHRSPMLSIPGAFFIDPQLFDAGPVTASRVYYERILQKYDVRFPETGRRDGDRAWLAPVKASSDVAAINALVEARVIDRRFVRAVLAIDFTNPVFSPVRAKLLTLLPSQATPHWKDEYIVRLKASSLPGAQELAESLVRDERDERYFDALFRRYISSVRRQALSEQGLDDYFRLLMQRRKEISASEISQNPRGRILEDGDSGRPGFRVIFPQSAQAPAPGEFTLNEEGYLMAGAKCVRFLR